MTRLDHRGMPQSDRSPARLSWGMSAGVALLAFLVMASWPAEGRAEDLISGIGLTRLTVYDQRPAPDGLMSGSPHVHAVTDEGYYVLSGRGRVELHDLKDGFRSVELLPGRYVQFPPGVVHRLVSADHLVLLVVMGNAGLAEHGDARIYFGKVVDGDPAEYARLVGLAQGKGLEGALDRRDAAIRAYVGLLEMWAKDRLAYFRELGRFIGVHLTAVLQLREGFSEAVEAGPVAWGERFRKRLANLPLGREELSPVLHLPPDETVLGMCGVLRPVTKLEIVGPEK
ncbi:MAG TPA: cupin domain-containing protein [Candidatus Latescibacteria bacterium]|nr:cupin domain-containing protein [Candidatus Latescibacterota bacterium]